MLLRVVQCMVSSHTTQRGPSDGIVRSRLGGAGLRILSPWTLRYQCLRLLPRPSTRQSLICRPSIPIRTYGVTRVSTNGCDTSATGPVSGVHVTGSGAPHGTVHDALRDVGELRVLGLTDRAQPCERLVSGAAATSAQ